jgi:hypothetical protein
VEFGVETDYNYVYKFYMKYCLQVNNYIHGDDAEL